MLTIKIKSKLACPKHPKFNPQEGESGIKGGCIRCFAIHDVWFKLQSLQDVIRKAEAIIGAQPEARPRIGMSAEL